MLDSSGDSFRFELLNNNLLTTPMDNLRIELYRWIAVPPEGSFRLEMEEAEWYVAWDNGEIEGPFSKTDASSVGELPSMMTITNQVAYDAYRSVNLAPMKLTVTSNTSRRNPEFERGNFIIKKAVYKVFLEGDFAATEFIDFPKTDPFFNVMGNELILNNVMAAELGVASTPIEEFERIQEWDKIINGQNTGPVLMTTIPTKAGFYSVSPNDLSSAKVDPVQFQIENMRVYANGVELPALFMGNSSGSFLNNSRLYFYVPESVQKRMEYTSVWITSPKDSSLFNEPPKRMETIFRVNNSVQNPGNFSRKELIFYPNEYSARASFQEDNGRWITGTIPAEQIRDFEFQVSSYDAETTATLRILLSGTQGNLRQLARIHINGKELKTETLIGMGPFERNYTIPKGILFEGKNALNIEYPQTDLVGLSPIVMFNFAEIEYFVKPHAIPLNQLVSFEANPDEPIYVSTDDITFASDNFILEVTDPFIPKIYSTSNAVRDSIRLISNSIVPESQNGQLLFVNLSGAKQINRLTVYKPRNMLKPTTGADIIVIADDRFLGTMERYTKRRKAQGYRVEVLPSSNVFATFGLGQKNDLGIHRSLQHAYRNWPTPRPSMVLLVGEASENWFGLTYPNPDVSENMIPVYGYASPSQEIRGDAAYAMVAGDGQLPDLEIGRFSVTNHEELSAIIDRIEQYEDSPVSSPWIQRHLFVTDDEPEFDRVANRIISAELNQNAEPVRLFLQEQPYEDYFRIRGRKRSVTMTNKITEYMNEGALTATYIGHGGPNLWSGERIYHYRDLVHLDNNGRRPIMTAASCDTAWVDYPVEPVRRSIGEQLISTPMGGGIALYAPVAATNSYEHDFLLRPFFEGLTTLNFERLGEVTMYSRLNYLLHRRQDHVTRQYILLGDPALRIPVPNKGISVEISPAKALTNRSTTFTLKGSVGELAWGTVEVKLLDPYGQFCGEPQQVVLANYQFNAELVTPEYKKPGDYRLMIQAYNEEENKFFYAEQPIQVLEPEVSLSWSVTPNPENGVLPGGTPVALNLTVGNSTQSVIEATRLKIVDSTTKKTLTEVPITLAPESSRTFEFKFPLPVGITLITAELSYSTEEEKNKVLSNSTVKVRGTGDQPAAVVVPTNLITVTRTGAIDTTIFELPVYNMTMNEMTDFKASLYLMDRPEGSLVGGTITAPTINPLGEQVIKITENVIFPSADLIFEFRAQWVNANTNEEESISIPLPISIRNSKDVAVVPGSVRTERRDYRKSETVYVTATVRNEGTESIDELRTGLYVRVPWDSTALANSINNQSVQRFSTPLAPGEEREVRLRWDPENTDPISTRLYVIVNDTQDTFEVDYSNNVGDIAIAMRRLPNLRLIPENVTVSPEPIIPGGVVSIQAMFENDSPYDFSHSFIVEINAQSKEFGSESIYRTEVAGLMAGETGMVQTNWVSKKSFDQIYISVNEEKEFGEETAADNVLYRSIDYVFPVDQITENDAWDFSRLFDSGEKTNAALRANGGISIPPFPREGETLKFSNEYNVGKPLPTTRFGSEADNLILLDNGTISWTPQETPEPASFRFPMSDSDDVTLYDVYIYQFNENQLESKLTNHYRYKLEDADWVTNTQQKGTQVYLGRTETKDDYLDISFAPANVASFSTIFSIKVVPIKGDYISPKFKVSGFPAGKFEAVAETPGDTSVKFEYRFARKILESTPWIPVNLGEVLPAVAGNYELQVKCILIGAEAEVPTVEKLVFTPVVEPTVASSGKGE
ncbi:MAG: C25 family cysteine peptidase [Sumerlaeia bacterium]